MIKSKYMSSATDWSERIRVMRSDITYGHWDYLYFKISLSILDAMDSMDYDREVLCKELLAAYKGGDVAGMKTILNTLEQVR